MDNFPEVFFSCDWGTSNFRLRLVRTQNLDVLGEIQSEHGIAALNRQFGAQNRLSRSMFFSEYLGRQLDQLRTGRSIGPTSVVVSGMASSTIGLKELPYARTPFEATGRDLVTARMPLVPGADMILVSGVSCTDDVMRGEETQAVGLAAALDMKQDGLLILPGTHSKHIRFGAGIFSGFRTYMTGELFQLLGEHSVLASSIGAAPAADHEAGAFLEGVDQGLNGNLAEKLFTVRSTDLLGSRSKTENTRFLSGLLIGSELSPLRTTKVPAWIAATAPLDQLYRDAIKHSLPEAQVRFIDSDVLKKALLTGHREILRSTAGN